MARIAVAVALLVAAASTGGETAAGDAEGGMDDGAEGWWKAGIELQAASGAGVNNMCRAGQGCLNGNAESDLHMLQVGAEPKKKIPEFAYEHGGRVCIAPRGNGSPAAGGVEHRGA